MNARWAVTMKRSLHQLGVAAEHVEHAVSRRNVGRGDTEFGPIVAPDQLRRFVLELAQDLS